MRILYCWSGWESKRRSWELHTADALKQLGHEVILTSDPNFKGDVDVIFASSNPLLAYHYTKNLKKPYVCWLIAGFPEEHKGTVHEEALASANLLLAVSETAKQDFLRTFPRDVEVHVAYHGVHDGLRMIRREIDGDEKLCFIGPPNDERKRFSWVSEVSALTGATVRLITPDVITKPPLGVSEVHINVGEERKFKLLTKSLALIVTSSWETFALHIAESASVMTPVISADLPVVREIWGDAVLYGDNPDELAWWVFELLENPKLGEKKGVAMRKVFERKKLDLESCAKRLSRYLEEVVS